MVEEPSTRSQPIPATRLTGPAEGPAQRLREVGARAGDAAFGSARPSGAGRGGPASLALGRRRPSQVPCQARASAGDDEVIDPSVALAGETVGTAEHAPAASATRFGGDATTATTTNLPNAAPSWQNYGGFKWWISWTTDGTSGWIVQKIENTYSGSLADGTAITNASVGVEPTYYEAWQVAANGSITGSLGLTGNRDRWERPPQPNGSQGNFGMTGTVYWTSQNPATSGFTSGGVANAGTLLSKKTAPAGLSAALLTRHAHGAWASTGALLLPACLTS